MHVELRVFNCFHLKLISKSYNRILRRIFTKLIRKINNADKLCRMCISLLLLKIELLLFNLFIQKHRIFSKSEKNSL